MFLELVRKEFIQRQTDNKQSIVANIISILLRVILIAGFICLESYIGISLDKKISQYSTYGYFDFLVLFLFVLMGLNIIFTLIKARKSIFDYKDNIIILPLPIEPSTKVFSKVTYLYIEAIIFCLITSSPLLICYGISRNFVPYYYIFSILYPLFVSIFSCGVSLLLSIVYQQLYKLVKQNDIIQFVLACLVVILACYLYQFILNLFLTVLNDSSIGGMFSLDFINGLHNARYYFLPIYHLLDLVIQQQQVPSDILIFLGASMLSLLVGVSVVSLCYLHEMKLGEHTNSTNKKELKHKKLVSPFKGLIKKEFYLLFKDETNLFSYTSLLILCPFLTFCVISSLNSIIYDNLRFYASYFPELISGINLCLILLFVGVINTSASYSISREGKSAIIVKYLPISPLKQMLAKIIIPFTFSLVSLLVTELVLIITNVITLPTFLASLFSGICIIAFTNVFGIYADMKDKNSSRKVKLAFINEIVPILVPIIIFGIFFVFSIYIKLPSWSLYLISCLFSLFILLSCFICFKSRYINAFNKMEVDN